ncbi:hypothetical protein Cpir12675_000406 [Ceratocystis pirilliformis]|uniref:Aminotransferase n=1 Tax=Ceratocystis pirilliformis TaxID=259994 RepID=A0ABR3ZMP5_9PEZI
MTPVTPTISIEPALMHRSLHELPLLITSAAGSTLYPAGPGSHPILDFCGGAAVTMLGHSHPEIIAAIAAQLQNVSYIHTAAYTSASAEALAHAVLAHDDSGSMARVYFAGSGSEATDAALKLARQFWVEKGQPGRTRFVARRQGYHGNTLGAMSVSMNKARRAPYEDVLMPNVSFVSPAYAFQYMRETGCTTEEEYSQWLADELEAEFLRLGPENVVCFIAETMVGATSGCVTAPCGYWPKIRKVCTKYDVLLVLDEVMCGAGRTGSFFAFKEEGIVPDIVTIGKGLGAGYIPLSAVLANKRIVEALRAGSAAFNHGHTFQAHALACASALKVQEIVQRDELLQRCVQMGELLCQKVFEAMASCKYVGEIRGRGLFWGIEFVNDKDTRKPFESHVNFGPRVQVAALEKGVAIYPGHGTVDGVLGDHVLLAPAFTISEEEIATAVTVLKEAYHVVEAEVDTTL